MAHFFTLHRIADSLYNTDRERVADITDAVRRARQDGLLPGIKQAEAVATVRELLAVQDKGRRRHGRYPLGNDPLDAPLAVKATKRSMRLARIAYNQCRYRQCRQGHDTTVKIGEPRVESGTARGEQYSRRCTYHKQESFHGITVPALWCVRVHARGLAVCDGMLTLDARRIPGNGPELYEAVWVEQGAGTSLKLVRGYIARIPQTEWKTIGSSGERYEAITYHAKSAKTALDGVQRKAGVKPPRRAIDLDRLVRRYGKLPVTLEDSFAAGNCRSGTASWCNAVGLNISAESVTLAEVVKGYKLRPMPEALTVIRRVVKEHRQWEKVLSEPRGNVRFDGEGKFRVE